MFAHCLRSCWEPWVWLHDFSFRQRVMRWSRRQLEASHRQRFRKLIQFVSQRSPYYREIMDQSHLDPRTCQPEQFPKLTRQLLIDRFDDLVTDRRLSRARLDAFFNRAKSPNALFENRYHVIHSTGTTGRRVYMAYSPREWIRGISHQIRYAGGLRWRKRCAFVGVKQGYFAGSSMTLAGRRGIGRLFYDCRCFDIMDAWDDTLEELNRFQPHVLSSYASALSLLAEAQRSGRLSIRPERLISSGEVLTPAQRRRIETSFARPVIDLYCATELLAIGLSPARGEPVVLFEDDLLFELHDDHFCVTSLFHTTTPLIRYQMEDALWNASTIRGAPFRTVQRIIGRSMETLPFRNNHGQVESFPTAALLPFDTVGVIQHQLVYQGIGSFLFRVQLEPGLTAKEQEEKISQVRRWLEQMLTRKGFDRSVSFRVEAVDQLVIDPETRKMREVISETHP